jgi:hypothetical protein
MDNAGNARMQVLPFLFRASRPSQSDRQLLQIIQPLLKPVPIPPQPVEKSGVGDLRDAEPGLGVQI